MTVSDWLASLGLQDLSEDARDDRMSLDSWLSRHRLTGGVERLSEALGLPIVYDEQHEPGEVRYQFIQTKWLLQANRCTLEGL